MDYKLENVTFEWHLGLITIHKKCNYSLAIQEKEYQFNIWNIAPDNVNG